MSYLNYYSFIIFLSFFCLTISQTYDGSVLRQKTCDRLANLVTDFITCQQVISWFDQCTSSLADGNDINTVASGIKPIIIGTLTSDQNMTIITKGAPLIFSLGVDGIEKAIGTLISVLTNNLMPFGRQMESHVQTWINDGMAKNVIENQIYYYGLTFFTKKRIGTLFRRYKTAVGSNTFDSLKTAYNLLIQFNLYPV